MGVLARFRKESPLEVFSHARRLRRDLIRLACRNFGLRGDAPSQGDAWLTSRLRDSMWNLALEMDCCLTAANSIYVTCEREAQERRILQDRAIGACLALARELELAIDTLPIDANKIMPHVAALDRQIALTRGWRKSDARRTPKAGNRPGPSPDPAPISPMSTATAMPTTTTPPMSLACAPYAIGGNAPGTPQRAWQEGVARVPQGTRTGPMTVPPTGADT